MTTVRIGPPVVNATDVLDYALALIEEHGWRQGPRVPDNEDWPNVAKQGLSLHDSIGMACYVLSGETQTQTRSQSRPAGGNNKDFPVSRQASSFGYEGTMREQATEFVKAVPALAQKQLDDVYFNDQASNVDEVLDVLRAAIAASEEAKV